MDRQQPSPESFLRLIHRARRGRLKIYLGHAPGVGKTYEMLLEGHQLKARGIDVAVGIVETHGRADTSSLVLGLEVLPRREFVHRGLRVEELDVPGVLARKPDIVLVDELAHSNAPGSLNEKRYQDVLQLLEAGIHVITTLNVQHLEGLNETVQRVLGVRVRERLPDWVLGEADQIVHVDLSAEDLHRRMEEGKIYAPDRVRAAMESFFRKGNLEQLRQLTLREMASALERKGRGASETERIEAPDQVAVLISSRSPDADALLRYASRLAGRLDRTWYALYVETPAEEAGKLPAETRHALAKTLELARGLGATVFRFRGEDVAETVRRFTDEYRIGHVVVGRPRRRPLVDRLLGRRSLVSRLLDDPRGRTLIVIDTAAHAVRPVPVEPLAAEPPATAGTPGEIRSLVALVDPRRVLVFDERTTKSSLLEALVDAAVPAAPGVDRDEVLRLVLRREEEASTFLPEGIALPHVRLPQVREPVVAVAVPRAGLSDARANVAVAFLLLLPDADPKAAIRLLAEAARLFRDGRLQQHLAGAAAPADVLEALRRASVPPSGGDA